MSDTRERNVRHLQTSQETTPLEWASAKQQEAFEWGPTPLCISGAFGAAKTYAAVLKILVLMDTYPGYRVLIGRRVWDELRKTTMATFFKLCPRQAWEPSGRRSDTEKILKLNNGSEVIWMHLDDPDTLSILRGLEINAFFFDQCEELEEEVFTVASTRLGRWDRAVVPEHVIVAETGSPAYWPWLNQAGKPIPPAYAILTCNPDHELHWIYERFHPESRAWQETYSKKGYKMIEMSAYDNKFLPRQTLEQMESQDESWKRRFLHGKWGIPEGQIHEVRPESMLEPTPAILAHIHNRCTFHRTMDHGDSAPTCVLWWAVDGDGNCFCYREYYMPNKLISEHRRNIAGMSTYERYQFQLADPAIFAASMQKHNQRWSVAEEYADCTNLPRETAIFWDKGDNDEFGTRNRISEYLRLSGMWQRDTGELKEVPRIHPITKEKGLWPRLFFIKRTVDYPNGCDQVVRQLKSMRREKLGTEQGRPIFSDERDKKSNIADHAYDALRYFMASQPPLPNAVQRKYSHRSFFGMRAMAIAAKKRGRMANLAKAAKEQYRRQYG